MLGGLVAIYAEILKPIDSGGSQQRLLEPGSLLGQIDEVFWVGGSLAWPDCFFPFLFVAPPQIKMEKSSLAMTRSVGHQGH